MLPGHIRAQTCCQPWCNVIRCHLYSKLVECMQEMYSHYTQQVKETSMSLSDPHKAYLLRKAVHYFNTQLKYRANIDKYPTNKPIIQVGCLPQDLASLNWQSPRFQVLQTDQ